MGAALVLAQPGGTAPTGPGGTAPTGPGGTAPTGPGGSAPTSISIRIDNPFKVGNDLYSLLQAIVNNIILPIGGILAVLAFVYSGFLYVTAAGNETKLAKAHKALLYTAIGTALLLGSWVFANVIRNTVNQLIAS